MKRRIRNINTCLCYFLKALHFSYSHILVHTYRGGAANFKVVRPGSGCGLGVALFQLVIAIMTIIIACLSLSSF